ncbi:MULTISPECIES: hypothetical protein [unclassified Streptomyces]|uniref:hypothetical protein n=1 Tax=unclassified Streptomyces TaxID=2593676 RepID=UPI000F511B16|nr:MULTISPECIES: hypothetical protein [unclassified Streptomyces]MDH6452815.1 hypothetical protein [Streptomyces sp. SAI-119]MDH6496626.1 hypothetical protein [Streptomyces sp. SAI-149]QUC56598.1 hypothetical protein IOD14_07215 [Streptomyces sp. A2-16]
MGTDERVCPVCGQPVETVVRRHKTLGAWVPVWTGGPCHNPECAACADRAADADEDHGGAPAGKGS